MKKEQVKVQETVQTHENHGMPRRDFFKLMGGGIFIFFRPFEALDLIGIPAEQARGVPKDYNAFLRIAEDGRIKEQAGFIGLHLSFKMKDWLAFFKVKEAAYSG